MTQRPTFPWSSGFLSAARRRARMIEGATRNQRTAAILHHAIENLAYPEDCPADIWVSLLEARREASRRARYHLFRLLGVDTE
jgi:hypothetical protein